MRYLIDIGHPAHVHLFKNVAWKLQETGNIVLFTCRDREHVIHLLKTYGFVYKNFGKHYKTLKGKIYGLAKNEMQMINTALSFKPDIFISHGSTIAAHASFFIGKPHIALEDTFNMEQVRLSMPFTDVVLTGDYPHPSLGKKDIQYPGYHELAYLHPNVFTPEEGVLESLGVKKGERYAIVRFVAWNASHDVGHKGLSNESKFKLIEELSSILKVFISSEADLPENLSKYQIRIAPEQMHNALTMAHLFVGESGTMASEAAILGTPAIFMNDKHFGCIDDQISYGVLHQFSESKEDQLRFVDKALELARLKDKDSCIKAARKMLDKKISVSDFLFWFVQNYPGSEQEMRKGNFDFHRFK